MAIFLRPKKAIEVAFNAINSKKWQIGMPYTLEAEAD
jgi:hypothetical protein